MIWLWRKDSNLRMAALTVRCLTNLATPQELKAIRLEVGLVRHGARKCAIETSARKSGGDEGSRTLIVRFTRPTLCYPVELHRQEGS